MKLTLLLAACLLVQLVYCDVYMHNPRGSNNRLNEKSATRRTGNRAFDSQNNARGGYNVGDRTDRAAGNDINKQYQMVYFQGSKGRGESNLDIEWTNQHGCGGNEDDNPNKLNCNIVLQYMCQEASVSNNDKNKMRDGTSTSRQDYSNARIGESENQYRSRLNRLRSDRVLQEPMEWYDKCVTRDRNKGLFIADQKVGGQAKNTRQNRNGNRNGLECPEERDYYPYWHPSDWKDIGVLAENASLCSYYESESFNVKPKHECVENWPRSNRPRHYSRYNNEKECESKGGKWTAFHNYLEKAPQFTSKGQCEGQSNSKTKYIWGRPMYGTQEECLVALPKPFCKQAPFSRVNHLGNGADLEPLKETWKLPYFPSGKEHRCVLRIRYNISTDDYDPYNTDSSSNGNKSPVRNDPYVDIGADNQPLKLNINTAQFGRTFQDRSHVFLLKSRQGTNIGDDANIHNLNVRGKRGNIVQTFPAVEYDFYPTNLKMKKDDVVHIQWTGSNTHNNGNPGGDGQTGDDGQGTGGTDRHNMLGLGDRAQNFPKTIEDPDSIFNNVESVKWAAHASSFLTSGSMNDAKRKAVAVQFLTSGYFHCVKSSECGSSNSAERKTKMNVLLNNAPASFGGMVLQMKRGSYNYTCSRNNNFTNRSQKGSIIVEN